MLSSTRPSVRPPCSASSPSLLFLNKAWTLNYHRLKQGAPLGSRMRASRLPDKRRVLTLRRRRLWLTGGPHITHEIAGYCTSMLVCGSLGHTENMSKTILVARMKRLTRRFRFPQRMNPAGFTDSTHSLCRSSSSFSFSQEKQLDNRQSYCRDIWRGAKSYHYNGRGGGRFTPTTKLYKHIIKA